MNDIARTARRYAQSAANYIACAESWSAWTDTDEDDRDPVAMMTTSIASAEADLRTALAYVEKMRDQLPDK